MNIIHYICIGVAIIYSVVAIYYLIKWDRELKTYLKILDGYKANLDEYQRELNENKKRLKSLNKGSF